MSTPAKSHSKPKSALRWYDHLLLRVIPPCAALAIKLLMLSCRVAETAGLESVAEALAESGGGAVYATWHQRMSYHFHHFGKRHVTMMISRSRDGEYAAAVARWLGFKNVRGSSTRGGSQALKELVARITQGEIAGMLADGPQGPPRIAKTGSVVMARDTGVPLIGVSWGGDRCWVFNSWDRYLLPKPFSRVSVCYAEPIFVPRSAQGEELRRYCTIFEQRLNEATRWCDEYFGQQRPWRRTTTTGDRDTGPRDEP